MYSMPVKLPVIFNRMVPFSRPVPFIPPVPVPFALPASTLCAFNRCGGGNRY